MKTSLLLAVALAACALSSASWAGAVVGHEVQAAPAAHEIVKSEQAPAAAITASLRVQADAVKAVAYDAATLATTAPAGELVMTSWPARAVPAQPGIARRTPRSPVWT